MDREVSQQRAMAVPFSRQEMPPLWGCALCPGPCSGHSQATISISMPCFLQQGQLKLASANSTCFQYSIKNALCAAIAAAKEISVDVATQRGITVSSWGENDRNYMRVLMCRVLKIIRMWGKHKEEGMKGGAQWEGVEVASCGHNDVHLCPD